MNNRKTNKSKEAYGSNVKRSEYDDGILRNNQRTGNKFRMDMTYYDRAQKVIMKDLGKESLLLQNKLESDRKTLSLGLYGSRLGMASSKGTRKYTPTSPMGTVVSNSAFKPAYLKTSGRAETRFPWDQEPTEKDSSVDKESSLANTSPVLLSKSNSRMRMLSSSLSSYPTERVQADDFLANILSEAMNDELLYTQRTEINSPLKPESAHPRSSRRKSKTPRRSVTSVNDSITNALLNAQETDEVIY